MRAISVLMTWRCGGDLFSRARYWKDRPGRSRADVGWSGRFVGISTRPRARRAPNWEKAANAAADMKQTLTEASLTGKIKAKMALDDSVKARAIDVTTSGSTVTLTGTINSAAERERAVSLARETDGITAVVDRLQIRQ